MGVEWEPVSPPCGIKCSHTETRMVTSVNNSVQFTLCMECGIRYSGAGYIHLTHQIAVLCDEQFSNPKIVFDRNMYFPKDALIQWNKFTQGLSSSMQSPLNISHRGCILIGSITTDKRVYCIWFIRPTVSYSIWSYVAAYGKVLDLKNVVSKAYAQWRPYSKDEISISICNKSTHPLVQVKGNLACLYHDMVRIHSNQISYCSTVSFAQTSLRIQTIEYNNGTVNIRDVALSEELIHSLLPQPSNDSSARRAVVSHAAKHVSIKVPRGTGGGASITIGCNGGMQYLGRMDQTCIVYTIFCNIVRQGMQTMEFKGHLSKAQYMTSSSFPNGIQRTTR
jgi:hypothetical protein